MRICTYKPAIGNEHVPFCNQTTGDKYLGSSVLFSVSGASKPVMHEKNILLEPAQYCGIDNDTCNGDGTDEEGALSNNASTNSVYVLDEFGKHSSHDLDESTKLLFTGLTSPSGCLCGGSLNLDYYPSSHSDSSLSDKEQPLKNSSNLSHSSFATYVVQGHKANTVLLVDPSTPSLSTTYQLHASSILRDHQLEYEECPQGDQPSPVFQVATSQPPSGNCIGSYYGSSNFLG